MPHHMRRHDRAITDPEKIAALLREGRFCTLALADESGPYAVTMSYGHDSSAGRLYFHCANEGRKIDAIAADSRACATVVHDRGYTHGACEHPYESVVLHGRMRVVSDEAEKLHGLRVLVEHLEDGPDAFSAMGLNQVDRVASMTALAFDIEHVSAKAGE